MRRQKTEAPCHSRCGTIKIPSDSEPVSAEYWPKFCRSILMIVIRQKGAANFERFILQSDGKKSY